MSAAKANPGTEWQGLATQQRKECTNNTPSLNVAPGTNDCSLLWTRTKTLHCISQAPIQSCPWVPLATTAPQFSNLNHLTQSAGLTLHLWQTPQNRTQEVCHLLFSRTNPTGAWTQRYSIMLGHRMETRTSIIASGFFIDNAVDSHKWAWPDTVHRLLCASIISSDRCYLQEALNTIFRQAELCLFKTKSKEHFLTCPTLQDWNEYKVTMWRPQGPTVLVSTVQREKCVTRQRFLQWGGGKDLFKSPLLNHSNELDVQQSTKLLQNQRNMKYKAAEQLGAPE